MSQLDKLINHFISGERGSWHYDLELGGVSFGGGQFFTRVNARKMLKNQLQQVICNDHILKHYLTLVIAHGQY